MIGARMTDRIVAVSAPLAEYLATSLHVPQGRISVIRNGIHLPAAQDAGERLAGRAQLGIAPNARVIGSVGRLDPVKAYDRLISAFSEVRQRSDVAGGPLMLVLVGDGPEQDRLRRHAEALGLGDSVRFLGWRKDVPRLLALMDIFVLSSDSEGTSLSLLEAMASGVAAVATAVGGTPDVFGPDGAGQLVPPGDTAALASALADLLRDADRRRELAGKGRAWVELHYSFEAMAAAYQRLYESLTGKG
jgi:glycosyltransferase involved in cell wall biosynthesis